MKLKTSNLNLKTSAQLAFTCFLFVMLAELFSADKAPSLAGQQADSLVLSDLAQARRLVIEDDWTGLSRIAPVTAHFTLERRPDGFAGTAVFSAGGYSGTSNKATEEIAVPLDKVEHFLMMLATCPIKLENYEPRIEHTDDYPSIKLEVDLAKESVVFFTQSQGEGYVPWGVTVHGRSYVIESDIPAKALDTLKPHFKYDVLERLKQISGAGPSRESADAVVAIQADWELSLKSNGALLYQQMVSNRDASGKPIAPRGPRMLPVFLELASGIIEPALTLRGTSSIPIRSRQFGTGIVVTLDGFILTTQAVAAAWKTPYTWDPEYYGTGAVLYVLNANLRPTRTQLIKYEDLPQTWVPANSSMLDRRPIDGRMVQGRLKYLSVTFDRSRASLPARLLRVSDTQDLALIKVDSPEPLKRVQLEDNDDEVGPGDAVVVLGYAPVRPRVTTKPGLEDRPHNTHQENDADVITSVGAIAKLIPGRERASSGESVDLYQITAPPLSSGSPVFLENGHLIGLMSNIKTPVGRGVVVVPVRYAKEIMGIR